MKQTGEVKQEDGNAPEAARLSVSSASSNSSQEGDKSTLYDSPAISEFDANKSSSPESVNDIQAEPMTPQWSMLSQSPTPEQMISPGMQTMGPMPGYDPNRIPAHVFSTKASNTGDWSTASNESLFSIHMGNSSFTSGEPFWLEEWNNSQQNSLQNSSEIKPSQVSTLPTVMEVSAHEECSVKSSVNSVQDHKLEREDSDKSLKEEKISPPEVVPPAPAKVPSIKGAPPADTSRNSSSKHRFSSSNPRLSDESGNSSSSFAFPV